MSDKPPKLPRLGFAGFSAEDAAAGGSRRKRRWLLWPNQEAGAGAAVARICTNLEPELLQGLGRKPRGRE
jgi:hypothetical protein